MSDPGCGSRPPALAKRILELAARPEDRPYLLADLEEELERRAVGSVRRARRWYWRQVLSSIAPCLVRRLGGWWRRRDERLSAGGWLCTLQSFGSDLRYALRTLPRRPLVPLLVVVSLALGIGAVTTAFAISHALLWRTPALIEEPETLVSIYTSDSEERPFGESSFPDFLSARETLRGVERITAHRFGVVMVSDSGGGGGGRRLLAEIVTGGYFELLGIELPLGRGFSAEETEIGRAERVVVISDRLWRRDFGGAPDVVGRELVVDGREWTVIGVAPRGLTGRMLPIEVDLWLPLGVPDGVYHATPQRLASRSDREFQISARLREGVTPAQLDAELLSLSTGLLEEHGELWRGADGRPLRLRGVVGEGSLPPDGRQALTRSAALVFAGTGLVLFLACSNVAGLLLARASGRRREMAVRLALGASRRRVMALLLTESSVLALAAGLLGLTLAAWATSAMNSLPLPFDLALSFDFAPDERAVGFTLAVTLFTCLLFGLAPALEASRPSLIPSLKASSGGDGRSRRFGLRRMLVVGQVAASLVFLLLAGLLMRGLRHASALDLGFDPERLAVMSRELPERSYPPAAARQFFDDVRLRLASRPEVEAVHLAGSAEHSPTADVFRARVRLPAGPTDGSPEGSSQVAYNTVTPGYLEMLGVRLLRGRLLDDADREGAPRVAVISESFVRRFWGGGDGLGERFDAVGLALDTGVEEEGRSFEVVGVVEDGRYAFVEGAPSETRPFFWISHLQNRPSFVMLHVKGRRSAEEVLPLLMREMGEIAGEVNMIPPTTFSSLIRAQYDILRGIGRLVALAGLFGLTLAAVGVYGAVSFAAVQRRREAAIRQAMGAGPSQVLRLALGDGLVLTLVGLGLGLVVGLPVARLLQSLLYGVSPLDPAALLGASLLLLAVALLASLHPALRLLRADPLQTLRDE